MKSADAIAFDYRPSRWLAAAIVALLALGLAALFSSALPLWSKVLTGAVAAAHAATELRRFLSAPVRRLAWQAAGHWRLVDAADRELTAELGRASVRGAWIVLNFRRSDGRQFAVVLAPDNSDAELRRRLRVRLARAAADM